VLALEELHEPEHLIGEELPFVEDRGGLLELELEHEEEPVGLLERGERVAAQAPLLERAAVDATRM
jgi:hypothetical protein